MFITDSTVAGSNRLTWRRLGMPALLTRMSTPPSSLTASDGQPVDGGRIGQVGDPPSRIGGVFPAAGQHLVEPIRSTGADAHHRPSPSELLGQSRPDARGCASHQYPLTADVGAPCSPLVLGCLPTAC